MPNIRRIHSSDEEYEASCHPDERPGATSRTGGYGYGPVDRFGNFKFSERFEELWDKSSKFIGIAFIAAIVWFAAMFLQLLFPANWTAVQWIIKAARWLGQWVFIISFVAFAIYYVSGHFANFKTKRHGTLYQIGAIALIATVVLFIAKLMMPAAWAIVGLIAVIIKIALAVFGLCVIAGIGLYLYEKARDFTNTRGGNSW